MLIMMLMQYIMTGHQKGAGSFPVWGSEIVFLRLELDKRYSIQDISKLPHFQHISQKG